MPKETLTQKQTRMLRQPEVGIEEDIEAVYSKGEVEIGWPGGVRRIFEGLARKYTAAIVGLELGDEGKGRMVDNKISTLLGKDRVDSVNVVRFQGGSNAGHTVEKDGTRIALHQIPSGIFHDRVVGIMDQGMVIHPEDLRTEILQVEETVGDTNGRLMLSQNAILCTDLERAEEVLNRIRQGRAKGGTGRGIGPSYAHHYDKLGFHIYDLMQENWRNQLGDQYERYEREFAANDLRLADVEVPDLEATKRQGKSISRTVGTKEEYLDRLEVVRTWLIQKDIVRNTFSIHSDTIGDFSKGVLFEGAQALGLHAWVGTRPDVTSSDTSILGISAGTGLWKSQDVADRVGVFKITYTSSVGVRRMPSQQENQWSNWVREVANEYGTTTGRPRDILHLDLPMLSYNARMSGIEVMAGTHLDVAREDYTIKVCTHYTRDGVKVDYQPGIKNLEDVSPSYVDLPGWDGKRVAEATAIDQLPENAIKFLSWIQRRTGYPIVAVTTGPARENFIALPGNDYVGE